tara:strand:+ start:52 stop:885 length:834 start_codon:yes stop_codon:yes gene_type:complete
VLKTELPRCIAQLATSLGASSKYVKNVVHIVIPSSTVSGAASVGTPRRQRATSDEIRVDDTALSAELNTFLIGQKDALVASKVRRVTFCVTRTALETEMQRASRGLEWRNPNSDSSSESSRYTFRHVLEFAEDNIMRNLEPPLAVNLELGRMSNFEITAVQTPNRHVHVYEAQPKIASRTKARRLFARAAVFSIEMLNGAGSVERHPFPERMFVEALDALEVALGSRSSRGYVGNHIFLNVLAEIEDEALDAAMFAEAVKVGYRRYMARLIQLRVAT